MNYNPFDGWRQRFIHALSLLLIVSVLARWIYDFLAPLLPALIVGVGLFGMGFVLFRRRRF